MIAKQNLSLLKLVVIFGVLWIVGVATSHTFGGFIHLLLVVAGVAILMRVVERRDPVRSR